MTRGGAVAMLLVALLSVLLTAGCGDSDLSESLRERLDPAPTPRELPTTAAESARLLADLRLALRPSGASDYDREAHFGSAWTDIDGNGCNQRDDVLLRDARPGAVEVVSQGDCDHDVVAGTWDDPYTGRTLTFTDLKDPAQAQAIQIDHVVPLSEAFSSGADRWTDERRRLFANTLDNLLAVDGPTNASKGDQDPAAWRPRKAHQCVYAKRWITVKHDWELAVDPSESRALLDLLGYCPE